MRLSRFCIYYSNARSTPGHSSSIYFYNEIIQFYHPRRSNMLSCSLFCHCNYKLPALCQPEVITKQGNFVLKVWGLGYKRKVNFGMPSSSNYVPFISQSSETFSQRCRNQMFMFMECLIQKKKSTVCIKSLTPRKYTHWCSNAVATRPIVARSHRGVFASLKKPFIQVLKYLLAIDLLPTDITDCIIVIFLLVRSTELEHSIHYYYYWSLLRFITITFITKQIKIVFIKNFTDGPRNMHKLLSCLLH